MTRCTDCGRNIPPVPGLIACGVAHAAQDGSPCLDGKTEAEPCTLWGMERAARQTRLTLEEWQRTNLEYLDL